MKSRRGKLVKFYGVAGTPFFNWFFPFDPDDAGRGKEEHRHTDEQLKAICGKAARELNLVVYGGECIMADDGSLSIIDFNDWPSFAPCRAEAAASIAKAAISAIKARREPNRNK